MTRVRLKGATEWMRIANDLLDGDTRRRALARVELWVQVRAFVEHVARLPIGPLNDDPDAKADIAVRVIGKLEAHDHAHVREWRARQVRARGHASWWRFVKIVCAHVAIDYARTSRRMIAPRYQPFEWVDEEAKDPHRLAATVQAPFAFLERASELELCGYLERFTAALPDGDAAGEAGYARPVPREPAAAVSPHVIRRKR